MSQLLHNKVVPSFSQTTPLNPNIKLNATLNAIYEVYNVNHVKCAENKPFVEVYIDSHSWITLDFYLMMVVLCQKNKILRRQIIILH